MTRPRWKVAIVKDTATRKLGGHALQVSFRGLPGVEIVALVDSNPENLEAKLGQTGAARHYPSCAELLAHERPDIVVLCSRHPGDHLEQVRLFAGHGCHVYCEKPVATRLTEADEMRRIAQTHGVQLALVHPARHDLGYLAMKRLIEAGEIGEPLTVLGRGKCDHRGGGEDLIVLGTHILDLMTFFFGAPDSVIADIRTEGRPATREDAAAHRLVEPVGPALGDEIFAGFRFPGGVRGVFETRRGLFDMQAARENPGLPRQMGLAVVGTKGVLSLRFDESTGPRPPLLISRRPCAPEIDAAYEEVPLREERTIPGAEPLDYALCGQPDVPRARWFLEAARFSAWDMIRALEDGRPPVSNIETASLALEMIQGIYAAHLSGGRIRFPLTKREHPLGFSS